MEPFFFGGRGGGGGGGGGDGQEKDMFALGAQLVARRQGVNESRHQGTKDRGSRMEAPITEKTFFTESQSLMVDSSSTGTRAQFLVSYPLW